MTVGVNVAAARVVSVRTIVSFPNPVIPPPYVVANCAAVPVIVGVLSLGSEVIVKELAASGPVVSIVMEREEDFDDGHFFNRRESLHHMRK